MKNTKPLWIILDLIFLIIFNTIFFSVLLQKQNIGIWISYGFIHFSYLMLLLTIFLIKKRTSSTIFGFSLFSISTIYFLTELVVGIVFLALSLDKFHITLIVQVCLAGLYGIILISNMIANEHTAASEERRQKEIFFIKDAISKLKIILSKIDDATIRKKVEKVLDVISTSPVKSHYELFDIEAKILESIDSLDESITNGDKNAVNSLLKSLIDYINTRNIQARSY
jgi:hypothetical protein